VKSQAPRPARTISRVARRATGAAGLEIRPLTLIFGRNSSGKSALIKLIRLALRAIAEPTTDRRDLDRDPSPGSRHLPLRIDKLKLAPRFIDLRAADVGRPDCGHVRPPPTHRG